MKTSVFVGISLDGFIARKNGDLDWLTPTDTNEPEEEHGFFEFFATVDALVMGRNTFDKLLTFDQWYYADTPVIVLTHRPLEIPARLKDKKVEAMKGEPAEVVKKLSERGFKHLYIDGGITVQRFMRAGLINRVIVSRLPVLIGEGIPLFGPLTKDVRLRHIKTKEFKGGMIQSEYEVL